MKRSRHRALLAELMMAELMMVGLMMAAHRVELAIAKGRQLQLEAREVQPRWEEATVTSGGTED